MGIEAHIIALALGRCADEPPNWNTLTDQYTVVGSNQESTDLPRRYKCVDSSNEIYFGCTFDEKGRPKDDDAALREEQMCQAQNEALALAITVASIEDEINKIPSELKITELETIPPATPKTWLSWDNRQLVKFGLDALDHVAGLSFYWTEGLISRVVVFRSSNVVSLTQLMSSDIQQCGFWTFFLPGLPAVVVRIVIGLMLNKRFQPHSPWRFMTYYLLLNSQPIRLQTLQKLFLMPTYTFTPSRNRAQMQFLADLTWSTSYWRLLAPSMMIIFPTVHLLFIRGLSGAITKYSKDQNRIEDTAVAQEKVSVFQRLRSIPAAINLRVVHLLQWTTDLVPCAARNVKLTTEGPLVENPGVLALRLVSAVMASIALHPVAAIAMRAQALHFASIENNAWLTKDMYPLFPSLTTHVGLRYAVRYTSKILICYGFQGVTAFALIGIRSAVIKHIISKRREAVHGRLQESISEDKD